MDGNNLTEHLRIFITSTLTVNVSETEKFLQPSADLEKASSLDIENYKTLIDFHLGHLDMSGVLTPRPDYSYKTHSNMILSTLEKILEISKKCAYIATTRQRGNGKKGIPGCNEYVRTSPSSGMT